MVCKVSLSFHISSLSNRGGGAVCTLRRDSKKKKKKPRGNRVKIDLKKATNLGELYWLPKIHKRISEIPDRPLISNCGTNTEKVSEFLDSEVKSVMQEGWLYIKDSDDFIKKLNNINYIPQDVRMVTADLVGLHPSISHDPGLEAIRKALDNREKKKISNDDLTKMAELVLKNNYFEFNGKVKEQIFRAAIGTRFTPLLYA